MSNTKVKLMTSIVVVVFVCGLLGYFIYWKKTPDYALQQIIKSVQNHDSVTFKQLVDVDSVASRLIDATFEYEIKKGGKEDDLIFEGVLNAMKPTFKDKIVKGMQNMVENGGVQDSIDVSNKMSNFEGINSLEFKGIDSIKKDGKIAIAAINMYERDLEAPLLIKLKLQEDNGQWRLIEVHDLKESLISYDSAKNKKLAELNKQTIAKIKEEITYPDFLNGSVSLANIYTKDYMITNERTEITIKNEDQIENFLASYNIYDENKNKIFSKNLTFSVKGRKYINSQNIILNPFDAHYKQLVNMKNKFKIEFIIYQINYKDGRVIKLLNEIPNK